MSTILNLSNFQENVMCASLLAEVMELYEISNPKKWLARERTAEFSSDDQWGSELFLLPGFESALGISGLEAVVECGIPITEIDTIEDPVDFVLKSLLDNGFKLFELGDVGSLIVVDTRHKPIQSICIADGQICGCSFTDYAFALHESWKRNPDRQKAHKARDYLCGAVEQLLAAQKTSA
jgi:hypothetical protein